MKNKRGVSPLLAAVLLIAFSIAMAAIVSNYLINRAKEFNPESIAQQSVFCESVNLGFSVDTPEDFGIQTPSSGVELLGPITLINRGSFSIHQLIINAPGRQSITVGLPEPIPPGAENKYELAGIQINSGSPETEISIVPIIKDLEKDQFVKCTDRQLIIDYKELCTEVVLQLDPEAEVDTENPCP